MKGKVKKFLVKVGIVLLLVVTIGGVVVSIKEKKESENAIHIVQDGTSKITIYEPKAQKEDIKFATIDDVDKKLEKLDFSEIDDLKDELSDLKKELKDIKNKLKTKKED